MRSIRTLAAATGILLLASACGGGGTPPPDNQPPVAGFSEVCTQLSCVFTDASTDPDGAADITGRSWTFGDQATSTETSPTHAYTAGGTYTVTLTVTDNAGATNALSKAVTVAAANHPPIASFDDPTCNTSGACTFHSTSTDADGSIATYLWTFGDPASGSNSAATADAAHTYNVTTVANFIVTLTVTDDKGARAAATKTITVCGCGNSR
jgi:PKD repeat protein